MSDVALDVAAERARQVQKHGGLLSDLENSVNDWVALCTRCLGDAATSTHKHNLEASYHAFIEVAATAIAAAEALDYVLISQQTPPF